MDRYSQLYKISTIPMPERGATQMEPAGQSSTTGTSIVVPTATNHQAVRDDGATLSPPNTWSSSSVELDDESDNRLLFTCTFELPRGNVITASTYADSFTDQYLPIGSNFMDRLEPKGQSFILSAAAASVKQRIFARVIMPDDSARACELLCEFEQDRAKITVLALRSAFTPSIHPFHVFTFITKHSSTCALTHIDYASIPYLGLLPTDLIGKSLLAFVYAPDVHVVRQAHIDLHNSRGKVVKSIAELRLVAHNGAILRSQTEWSAYVNPWTKKMELVVARHKICSLPIGDADVLAPPAPNQQVSVLPTIMAKTFEDELRSIMNRPVPSTSSKRADVCVHSTTRTPAAAASAAAAAAAAAAASTFFSQGCQQPTDLGAYIDKLVEHLVVNSTAQQGAKNSKKRVAPVAAAASTSSSTGADPPLSYTQINCLENVHRLLKSQSRPDSPERDAEPFDEKKYPPALPLTKETLHQHTKKFEEEYKDTWCRRLKRLSDDIPCSPPPAAKQFRPNVSQTPPLHWSLAQKQEFYRSLAPNPPPPPGKNYQITYTPLDDPSCDEKPIGTPKSDVENVLITARTATSTPNTGSNSVIHPNIQRLVIATPPAAQQHQMNSVSSGAGTPTTVDTPMPLLMRDANVQQQQQQLRAEM